MQGFLLFFWRQANGVIAAYNKIMRAQRGEVEVVVTTAKELR